jgi:hypothetical protein
MTDHDYSPREPILAESETEIMTGDVVVDLARGAPLQVISRSSKTAGEHERVRSDTTAALFGVDDDERVFNCVFLPTPQDNISAPSKSYAYPESRLLRYPVEQATTLDRLQREMHTNVLEALAVRAAKISEGRLRHLLEVVALEYDDEMASILDEFVEAVGGDSA